MRFLDTFRRFTRYELALMGGLAALVTTLFVDMIIGTGMDSGPLSILEFLLSVVILYGGYGLNTGSTPTGGIDERSYQTSSPVGARYSFPSSRGHPILARPAW